MPLHTFDTQDAIPEPQRASAIALADGKFAVLEEPDVSGLKTKNSELLTKLTAAQRRAALLGDRPDEDVLADLELAAKAKEAKAKAEGDFESLKTQLITQHKSELDKVMGRTTKVEGKLYDVLAKREAERAIAARGLPAKVLLPHVLPYIKVVEHDDDFEAQVVDARGKPRIADGQATPMTIDQLVDSIVADPDFAGVIPASGASGSGARNDGSHGGRGGDIILSKEQGKDPQIYRRAKADAEKRGVNIIIRD